MSISISSGVVAVEPKQIVAGSGVIVNETDTTITISSTGGSGGSTIATGNVLVDFGSAPGTNIVTTTITGQTAIVSTSKVKAVVMLDSTATHNSYEHMIAPIKLTCGNIVNGVGFDIYAVTDWRLTGTFNITWEWI